MNIIMPTYEDTFRYGKLNRFFNNTKSGNSATQQLCGSITRGMQYRNLGGRLAAIGGKKLPYDYEVRYIYRSILTSFLDIGFTPNASNSIEIECECSIGSINVGRGFVFGNIDSQNSYIEFQRISDDAYKLGWYENYINLDYQVGTVFEIKFTRTKNQTTLEIISPLKSTKVGCNYSGIGGSNYNLYAINRNYVSTFDVRIGRVKFYVDGILMRSFIPCLIRGVVGYYDEITNDFIYQPTSGTLLAGPRV